MSRYYYIIIPFILGGVLACQSPNESLTPNRGTSPNNGGDSIQTAAIDTSDLHYLPEDTGGTHQANPLGTTSAGFGYYIYKPSGYKDDGPKYPLILFLHGWGERGDSGNEANVLDNILRYGPPSMIQAEQWEPKYPFLVVSPQLVSEIWPPHQIHNFIEYLIKNYQINTTRIYLTGLSLGGGGCWLYAGGIEDHYAAAIVPISSSGGESLIKNLSNVPVWAFHGENDNVVDAFENFGSVQMVEMINRTNPPVRAKVTVYTNVGHNAWSLTYRGAGMHNQYWFDKYNMNIFDWMLQFKKDQFQDSE